MKNFICAILCGFHLLNFEILMSIVADWRFVLTRPPYECTSILFMGIAAVVSSIVCKRPILAIVSFLFPILSIYVDVSTWRYSAGNNYGVATYIIFWLFVNISVFSHVRTLLASTGVAQKHFTVKTVLSCMFVCAVFFAIAKQLLMLQRCNIDYVTAINFGLLSLTFVLLSGLLSPLVWQPSPFRRKSILLIGALLSMSAGSNLVGVAGCIYRHPKEDKAQIVCVMYQNEDGRVVCEENVLKNDSHLETGGFQPGPNEQVFCLFCGSVLLAVSVLMMILLVSRWVLAYPWQALLLVVSLLALVTGLVFVVISIPVPRSNFAEVLGVKRPLLFGLGLTISISNATSLCVLVLRFGLGQKNGLFNPQNDTTSDQASPRER